MKGPSEHAIRITTKEGLTSAKAHFEAQQDDKWRASLQEVEVKGLPADKSTLRRAPGGEKSTLELREVPVELTPDRSKAESNDWMNDKSQAARERELVRERLAADDRDAPVQGTLRRAPSLEPLILVDGKRAEGGLKMIADLDVKSVEIIKGAAAEATYGPDGRNGVVLVTTRGGGN